MGVEMASRVQQRRRGHDPDQVANTVSNGATNRYASASASETTNGDIYSMSVVRNGKWLVPHSYLPSFLADNEFLINSHRPQLNSFGACFKSMFFLHTETWNIWTHIGGSVLFMGLSVYYLQRAVNLAQTVTFLIFFMGAIICMGCSGIYHTVLCHSEPVYRLFSKIDYCGVIILIMASWAPWLHYAFYCSFLSKVSYAILVTITGSTSLICILNDKFAGKEFRPLRAALFVALGLTGLMPGIHYMLLYDVSNLLHVFIWLILMAVIYIVGAGIYAVRFPECLFPGTFDIWSHQIMHVCVVVAAVFCYHGASMLADLRITGRIDCSGAIAGSEKLTQTDF